MKTDILDIVTKSKLFIILLIVTIIVAGSPFLMSPVVHSTPHLGKITVNDQTFNLSKYPSLEREVIGIWNNLRDFYKVT